LFYYLAFHLTLPRGGRPLLPSLLCLEMASENASEDNVLVSTTPSGWAPGKERPLGFTYKDHRDAEGQEGERPYSLHVVSTYYYMCAYILHVCFKLH
jgi:hypothetical protein